MCRDGFRLISEELTDMEDEPDKPTMSRKAEVMAKILIDIYMSKLIDAATVVKIGNILSEETHENVTIVCHLGSCTPVRCASSSLNQSMASNERRSVANKTGKRTKDGFFIFLRNCGAYD